MVNITILKVYNARSKRRGEKVMKRKMYLKKEWPIFYTQLRISVNSNYINSNRSTPCHIIIILSKAKKKKIKSSMTEETHHI